MEERMGEVLPAARDAASSRTIVAKGTMKALVYRGPGFKALEEHPTRLVDTITTHILLKAVQAKKVDPNSLISHHFAFDRILDAYDTFGRASDTGALKVIVSMIG
jgi:threonine dehydrogenase-like Zn-dependent dehydrogenase